MFCQLLRLRTCIPLEQSIRRALDELPKTLDETYARTLEEIGGETWKYAHLIFQCVTAASRPLLVRELAQFLTFDFEAGSTPTFLPDQRLEDPAYTVQSMCSSLLAVVKPQYSFPVVQFAHFSVQEYLMSTQLTEAKYTISRFHISMTTAHTIVAQACLGVLLHFDENVTKDSLGKFPLAEYAAEHWVGHARFEKVSSKVQDEMKRLFDPSKHYFAVWVWLCDPEDTWSRFERPERPGKANATPLHYAALCGICDVVKFLIVERSQDVNARGFNKDETPLHVALRSGHAGVARLLLEHGADAKAQDGDKSTPLLLASRGGHAEVARVLLKHGVDPEVQDEDGWSPLEVASFHGHVEVARVLLEHGADVKNRDTDNRTPLYYTRREEIARFLLEHGADANALDTNGQTPLHLASELGRLGAARAFLAYGADANARDANGATPLHLASYEGVLDAARLLLQYGADIHALDNEGRTPFMRATAGGNDDMMDLLLEHGAEDHRTR